MPGAGSTKGANYFAARVKPDGLTIFGSSGSTQFPFLRGDPRVKFDYADWHIVLATATGGVAYLPADLGARWKADPKAVIADTNFIYGSQGATRLDLEHICFEGDLEAPVRMRADGTIMPPAEHRIGKLCLHLLPERRGSRLGGGIVIDMGVIVLD